MEYRILGNSLDIRTDAGEAIAVSRRQTRQLLSVLALHPDGLVKTDRLAELMWEPEEVRNPTKALHQAVLTARKVMPNRCLSTEAGGYRLHLAKDDYLDLRDFEQLTEQAGRKRRHDLRGIVVSLERALALWGSLPLGDLPMTSAMETLEQGLLERRRQTRVLLAEALLELGEHHRLIPKLRLWLAEDGYDEQLRGMLMLTLYRADHKAEALQVHGEAVELMGDQSLLGPALRRLAGQIACNDPSLAWAPTVHCLGADVRHDRPSPTWTATLTTRHEELTTMPALPEEHIKSPNIARMYDYVLGGKNYYEVDRAHAEAVLEAMPGVGESMRQNRRFLIDAVRHMSRSGVRQFLDIGCGLPTMNNTHTVAQAEHPDARVAYIDHDPVVIAHGRALLAAGEQTAMVQGDLNDPAAILDDPDVRRLLDFSEPIGILLVAIVHFIPDAAEPLGLVQTLRDAVAPGSYLALSHASRNNSYIDAGLREYNSASTTQIYPRDLPEIRAFFGDWELIVPGLVAVENWTPDATPLREQAEVFMAAGLGRNR